MLVEHVYWGQSWAWDCGVVLLARERVYEKDVWVAYLSDVGWSFNEKWEGVGWGEE